MRNRRICVLGLYNSGSTALAGMLHRLGVHMGPPFWMNDDPESDLNFYEPRDMARVLRKWWTEPRLEESTPTMERRRYLKDWIGGRETRALTPVGAKHPLLSLCAPDVLEAWGEETLFVWAFRPLEESIAGLERRRWFPGQEARMQTRLWDALHAFASARPGVIKVEWRDVKADPGRGARELADVVELRPTAADLASAAGFVRGGA